MLKFSKMQ